MGLQISRSASGEAPQSAHRSDGMLISLIMMNEVVKVEVKPHFSLKDSRCFTDVRQILILFTDSDETDAVVGVSRFLWRRTDRAEVLQTQFCQVKVRLRF